MKSTSDNFLKGWIDYIMARRAAALTERLCKHIFERSHVADIGSGTGHNAHHWRTSLGVTVDEYDVADLHWIGAGPTVYDGIRLPAADGSYEAVTILFVLQYANDPSGLLKEVRRTCSQRVLILQSTYRGKWGRFCLAVRELVWGRIAFHVARMAQAVREQPCPLNPQTVFTREELLQLFDQAGYDIHSWESREWYGMNISRDLFVLEPKAELRSSPSSSPPAMKDVG